MERRFDEMPTALVPAVHALRRFGQERLALLVLIQYQDELFRWIAIFRRNGRRSA